MITGAGSGIGEQTALALAKAGADIAVNDLDPKRIDRVTSQVEGLGRRSLAVRADVSNSKEVEWLTKTTLEKFGRIDILINNAGISIVKPFLETTESEYDSLLDINLKGQFLCAQAVAREMVRSGRGGKILNIASLAALAAFPRESAYNASKAGVILLTKTLAVELGPYKINVNAIAPGITLTPMIEHRYDPKIIDRFVPLGRVGKPQDIAKAALFLVSDDADYITGSVLAVDGGFLAGFKI